MNQNKLKLVLGASAIVSAIIAITLLLVGIIAIDFSDAALVKVV